MTSTARSHWRRTPRSSGVSAEQILCRARFMASTPSVLPQRRTLRCGTQAGSPASPSAAFRAPGAKHLVNCL